MHLEKSEKRIRWGVIAIGAIGGVLCMLAAMSNTGCADIGAGEPVVTVTVTSSMGVQVAPDSNGVYHLFNQMWYTPSISTDDPADIVGEIVFIGDGPELGWRGFRYLLLDPADNGTLRTASVTITRDGREFTKEIVFQISYSIP